MIVLKDEKAWRNAPQAIFLYFFFVSFVTIFIFLSQRNSMTFFQFSKQLSTTLKSFKGHFRIPLMTFKSGFHDCVSTQYIEKNEWRLVKSEEDGEVFHL